MFDEDQGACEEDVDQKSNPNDETDEKKTYRILILGEGGNLNYGNSPAKEKTDVIDRADSIVTQNVQNGADSKPSVANNT